MGAPNPTLLRDSFFTAAIGIVFLASTVVGRPLMFLIIRSFAAREDPDRLDAWDRQRDESARFRRVMREMTVMWGVAFLAEFGVKVVMVSQANGCTQSFSCWPCPQPGARRCQRPARNRRPLGLVRATGGLRSSRAGRLRPRALSRLEPRSAATCRGRAVLRGRKVGR